MPTYLLLVISALSATGAFLFLHTPSAYALYICNAYQSFHSVPTGYGAAYDVFQSNKEVFINADCGNDDFRINIGHAGHTASNFAVYKTGYRWTGSTWQAVSFTPDGGSESGNYIMGRAKSAGDAIGYSSGVNSFFVAFTCSKQSGVWKCGCSDSTCATHKWQLQATARGGSFGIGSNTNVNSGTTSDGSGNASEADKNASPANKLKGLPLLWNFDAYWKDLLSKGQKNPSTYFNIGANDTRNKCVSAGCTRTLAEFTGRAAMKFTTYAGYNYSAVGVGVSNMIGFFAREQGKSYGELMESVDVYIPSSANWNIPTNLLSVQSAASRVYDRCQITGKGVVGVMAGQVNPLPPVEGNDNGWFYTDYPNYKKPQYATFGITGPGVMPYGNRECSGFYQHWNAKNNIGFWDVDDNSYMEGYACETGTAMNLPRDKWFTLEAYGKLDTSGSNGKYEVYVDGTLVCGNSNIPWGGNRGWRFVGFGGVFMWGGAGDHMVPRDTTSIYYSNVRVFGR